MCCCHGSSVCFSGRVASLDPSRIYIVVKLSWQLGDMLAEARDASLQSRMYEWRSRCTFANPYHENGTTIDTD